MTATTVLTTRALLLDMDGTLVDSGGPTERVWRRWAAVQGLDGDAVMSVVHGRQGQETMAELLPDRPMEENHRDNARLLAEESADMDGVVPVAGGAEFLASLAAVPYALVTSAPLHLAERRMAAAGLPLPSVRVTAESVGASKPDPEGFLKGAAELGVPAADCVVFEDSEAGIRAGLAAGMQVVGIGPRARAHGPTVQVDDLTRVRVSRADDGTVTLHIG
ncbi:HAD-IA family hydrolase [Streptomyces uncialis]|uniref:HAD-IA family hydrolase n=1 Tax=Streptomyces uncialis TaxID=1048205 RepID=UPI00364F0BD6